MVLEEKIEHLKKLLGQARDSVEEDLNQVLEERVFYRNRKQRAIELRSLLSEIDKEIKAV